MCECVDRVTSLSGDEVRFDLHADGLERIPAALPVHPHHAVVRAVLGHELGVGAADVVAAVGIGRVAAVVPPAASVLPGALFGGISGGPGSEKDDYHQGLREVLGGRCRTGTPTSCRCLCRRC